MTQFIDRRTLGKSKSTVNRQRFLRRHRKQIKKALGSSVGKRSITNIDTGDKISISAKDINEPIITHGAGGVKHHVLPGNKEFTVGDTIDRPPAGGAESTGSKASNQGKGEDDFIFNISRDEFLDLYFDDLELPDLIKKQIANIPDFKNIRMGYTMHGSPGNISVTRSMKQAACRRVVLGGKHKRRLKKIEEELALAEKQSNTHAIEQLHQERRAIEKRLDKVPFIDTIDLRYRNRVKEKRPSTQAVMFCVMDVSGSMDEVKKDIAKRFFILLYLFLKRNYEKIELVFIRHHTSAKEVDEKEFFYSRETGGTVVSSALEKVSDIIDKRYDTSSWNVYVAQASDGDNWNADSPYCQRVLANQIIPKVQYYAYVEIMPRHHQSLWDSYSKLTERFPNFAMQNIDKLGDIYPVFRELFKRQMV